MSFRYSRLMTHALVFATVFMMSARCWAVFYPLGASKDEWGLKYEVEVTAADNNKLNVHFTLADQGRLKPIYSASVVAFSDLRSDGSRAYLLNTPIDMKVSSDGKLSGQIQIGKEFIDRARIRILTLVFDGRQQTAGARYYEIPLKKYLNQQPAVTSSQSAKSTTSSVLKSR